MEVENDPGCGGTKAARRARPAWLRALGRDDPPAEVTVDGVAYRRAEIFKHDSWAATASYVAVAPDAAAVKIVCKFNRRQSLLGLPAAWLGRRLARREAHFLRRLGDLPFVPRLMGTVYVADRAAENAVARAFIEGRPLGRHQPVSDDFFPQLAAALQAVHARGAAYVDLHKRENVMVGDDGRPYLFDFQVSFDAGEARGLTAFIARALLRHFQQMDEFCFVKLHRHCRPDQCPLSYRDLTAFLPRFVGLHRIVAQPLRALRRRLLVRLGVRAGRGRVESERFVEAGLRNASAKAA